MEGVRARKGAASGRWTPQVTPTHIYWAFLKEGLEVLQLQERTETVPFSYPGVHQSCQVPLSVAGTGPGRGRRVRAEADKCYEEQAEIWVRC